MKLFERDNLIELPRFTLGILKGVAEVYLRPALSDLAKKAMRNVYIPNMAEVNAHMNDCVRQEAECQDAA